MSDIGCSSTAASLAVQPPPAINHFVCSAQQLRTPSSPACLQVSSLQAMYFDWVTQMAGGKAHLMSDPPRLDPASLASYVAPGTKPAPAAVSGGVAAATAGASAAAAAAAPLLPLCGAGWQRGASTARGGDRPPEVAGLGLSTQQLSDVGGDSEGREHGEAGEAGAFERTGSTAADRAASRRTEAAAAAAAVLVEPPEAGAAAAGAAEIRAAAGAAAGLAVGDGGWDGGTSSIAGARDATAVPAGPRDASSEKREGGEQQAAAAEAGEARLPAWLQTARSLEDVLKVGGSACHLQCQLTAYANCCCCCWVPKQQASEL